MYISSLDIPYRFMACNLLSKIPFGTAFTKQINIHDYFYHPTILNS